IGYDSFLCLWDPITGKEVRRLEASASHLVFAPDGKTLATGDYFRIARVWDVAKGKFLRQITVHDNVVAAIAYAPDGRALATTGSDGRIRLWDPVQGKDLLPQPRHAKPVTALAFAPDGKTLATAGEEWDIVLWDPTTGAVRQRIVGPNGGG